jgi:hypothetical protein
MQRISVRLPKDISQLQVNTFLKSKYFTALKKTKRRGIPVNDTVLKKLEEFAKKNAEKINGKLQPISLSAALTQATIYLLLDSIGKQQQKVEELEKENLKLKTTLETLLKRVIVKKTAP